MRTAEGARTLTSSAVTDRATFFKHLDLLADTPGSIEKLRNLLRHLAVRGDIASQIHSDGTGHALLSEIRGRKGRREIKGSVPPEKYQDAVRLDEEPYRVPENWCWTRIGTIVISSLGGGTPSKNNSSYWGGDIPWASVKDVGHTKFLTSTQDTITREGLENSSSNLIPQNRIIVCTRMGLGKISINKIDVAINQDLRALELPPEVDRDFFYNFYLTLKIEGTGMTVTGITVDELMRLPFPLPPQAEQRRIVAKVDELMALCDELEAQHQARSEARGRLQRSALNHMLAACELETFATHWHRVRDHFHLLHNTPDAVPQLRQAILDLAFQGKLTGRHDGDDNASNLLIAIAEAQQLNTSVGESGKALKTPDLLMCEGLFPVPHTWCWTRLHFLCEQIGDIDHKMPKAVSSGVPFLSAKDLKDDGTLDFSEAKHISDEDYQRLSRKIQPTRGDIVYSRIGARLGKARLVDVDMRFLISYSCCLVRPKHQYVEKKFLQLFLDSHLALDQASSGMQSIGVPDLGLGEIKEYRIPLPPLAEQKRIVAKVDELMRLCDELEAKLTQSRTLGEQLLESTIRQLLAS